MPAIGITTHFLVTPVVGIIPWPYPLRLQETEVARAFIVPLSWLADHANFYTSTRIMRAKPTRLFIISFSTAKKSGARRRESPRTAQADIKKAAFRAAFCFDILRSRILLSCFFLAFFKHFRFFHCFVFRGSFFLA
jgi:hypothetical protein